MTGTLLMVFFHLLLFAGSVQGAECPGGWFRSGGYCYWLGHRLVSFEDAQGVCASWEASLVSLSIPGALNATMVVARASPGVSQLWTCALYDPSLQSWVWLDGARYNAHNVPWWGGREPQLRGVVRESCAVLTVTSGRMNQTACTARATPMCRRSAYKKELCKEDDGWHAIGNSCYKLFNGKQTWIDADKTCRDQSATLLPLPFSNTVRSVIQQTVVCDTSDNDVWISSIDVSSPLSRCNWVSVMYNQILVQGSCLMERKFICQKPQGSCAEGWQSHEGRCYRSTSASLPWFSAARSCQDLGATLLVISDNDEEDFIKSQMIAGSFAKQMWLGLSDLNQDGTFEWSDGTPVSNQPTHWAPGYPLNSPSVDCGVMQLERTDAYWSDGYCYKSLPFVCEMSLSDDVRNVSHSVSCKSGWQLLGDKCYLLGDNKNYEDANTACYNSASVLASVLSPLDQSSLAVITAGVSEAWIGLQRSANSRHFVWMDTGTVVNMNNWLAGEPRNQTGALTCVQVVGGSGNADHAGAWRTNDCTQPAPFVCQMTPQPNVVPLPVTRVTAPWSWRCGEGWTLSPTLSTCFLLVTQVTVPWASARAQCLRHGADLVSITSYREQTVVEALVRSAGLAEGGGAWSGLWIGATDNSKEGGWEWTDSSPFRYLHWSAGQPDNRGFGGEEQDCAVVVPADTLQWDDRDCDELHNYICKKTAAPESTTPPVNGNTQQPSGQCEGWAMLSGEHSVADSMLIASSFSDNDHRPLMSRLLPANTGAWMSNPRDTSPWVGVVFETLVTVRGVQTTGAGSGQGWVSQYKLQYRYDSTAPPYWYSDPPGNPAKLFPGNNDTRTPVTNRLAFAFAARQVFLFPTKWTGPAPTLRWEILGCVEEECQADYAISGPLVVPDNNLTASSASDPAHAAPRVRLTPLTPAMTLTCWRPLASQLGPSQWIQADFERVEILRGVSTRGNPVAAEWVRSFLLLYYSPIDQSWKPYEEPYGSVKVFTGNVDNNSTVTTYLKSFIPTQRVRLQPQTWQGYIALQMDILVCEPGCQEQALLAKVSDEQLSATSSESHHGPEASRLSSGSSGAGSNSGHQSTGGWQAEFTRSDQYIQVSLNVPQEVRAVATQGRLGSNSWVTAFYLSWSMDAKNWTNYTDNGHSTTYFVANYGPVSVHKHYLTPFMAQYVRLHPTKWTRAIGLSWELYGCPGKNSFQSIGCFADHANDRDLPYEPYTDLMDGMDPILCSRHCFNKGYSYAGLQARDKCYCGNSVGRYGVSPDCNIQCFPQRQFNCGGTTANSVYSTGLTAGFSVCPTGSKRLRDQCYQYFSTASDWDTARAACAAQHAHLASVADRSVNLLLYSLMGAATDQNLAWIGLNDQREGRYFEWSNEEEVVYTDWDLHQPAPSLTGESRHCVAINNQTGGWVTEDCSRRLPYLCMTNPRPSDHQPNITAAPEGCPQGTVAYLSFCYVVVEENRTWSAAGDVCTAFGGSLLVVNTRFEQAFVTSLLSGRSGLYWTDVSDVHNPGLFTYANGQYDVMFTNWDTGMPDSHRYGHCVAMGAGSRAGLWRNEPCGQAMKAICRLPRDNFPQPAIPVMRHASNCSTNWVDSNSSLCYQINSVATNLQRSWAEARADCEEQRGDLASFPNTPLMEQFWRNKLLGSSNHFWIGLHALPNGELAWSDHRPVAVNGPWSAGQPDTANGTQTCVELHAPSGTLALRDCRLPRNWLCAVQSGIQPFPRMSERILPTAGPAGSCLPLDDTWKRYGDFCYRVTGQPPATWRQARLACQQHKADLASVMNVQENTFILALAQQTPQQKVWMGLNELMSPDGYYRWSDGSRVRFVNWDGNGPDDADGQESCVEMLVRTGKWNDNHCALPQAYVCKRNMSPLPPTTHTTFPPDQGGCGDGGWVVFGTRCYLVQGGGEVGKTWQQAFEDCKSKATPFARVSLASVRGPRENAFLTTQLYRTGMVAWVGLHLVNQTYLWVDEGELTYTNWDIGEPNGGQQAGCVYLHNQGANAGRWNDEDCNRHLGWICESTRFPHWNVPTTPPSHCPGGFQRLGSSCYRYWNATHLSWQVAQSTCHQWGAHLVSVLSQVEQDFVYLAITGGEPVYFKSTAAKVYPPAWLGLAGSVVQGATLWQWSDGWPVAFTSWGPGGYLNVTSDRHCVAMDSNGTWFNQDCSTERPFVCKISSEKPPFTRDPSSGECVGHEWTAFGSQCYAFYVTERVTFAHAAFTCRQRGASLVSIHSPSANQFLQNEVKAKSALPVWIGFRHPDQGSYSWRDESEVDYTNWDTGYPKGSNGDGTTLSCAQLTPWSGRWIDDNCNALFGYVCMKNKVYETSTPASTQPSSGPVIRRPPPGSHRLRMGQRPSPSSKISSTAAHARTKAPVAARQPTVAEDWATPRASSIGGVGRRESSMKSSKATGGVQSRFHEAAAMPPGKSSTQTGNDGDHDNHHQSSSHSGRIVVPTVTAAAVVVVVALIVLGVWLLHRRRHHDSVNNFIRHLYQSAD